MTMQDRAQVSEQTVMLDVAGTRLAVHRWGQGQAIVCLHAIAHGARDYARLGERLGNRFSIVAIDFPGHGESPYETLAPTAQRYAELLAATVDALGLKSFALLGCSIGGGAAIRYAAAHPERVAALILCNSAGLQKAGLLARIVCGHYARFFAKGERGDKSYARKFARYYRTVLPGKFAAWRRDEIVADAYKTAGMLRAAWQGFSQRSADLRHVMPTLKMPILYAWAKGDSINAWSRCKRAGLSAPNHTVKLFLGGHAAFLETPEVFDAELLAFVEKQRVFA